VANRTKDIFYNEIAQSNDALETYRARMDVLEAVALVQDLRNAAGLSRNELATRIGVTEQRIGELERPHERQQGPTYGLLKRISRACGLSLGAQISSYERKSVEGFDPAREILLHEPEKGTMVERIIVPDKARQTFNIYKTTWLIMTYGVIQMIQNHNRSLLKPGSYSIQHESSALEIENISGQEASFLKITVNSS